MDHSGTYSGGPLAASAFRSVPDLWHHRVGSTPDSPAFFEPDGQGGWRSWTWRQAAQRVRDLANGLLAAGLKPEERCAIVARTSVDWILADLAILCAGGATTAIHAPSTQEEISYILEDCNATCVFVDSPELADKVRRAAPAGLPLYLFQGQAPGAVSLRDLAARGQDFGRGRPHAYQQASAAIQSHQLASLMYTSGTTGVPKGVRLSHDAWVYEAEAVDALEILTPADVQYLFLPLSHVFAKVMEILAVRLGLPTYVDWRPDMILPNLASVRPTWMAAVPQVFEVARNAILEEARRAGPVQRRLFHWALEAGLRRAEAQATGQRLRRRQALPALIGETLVGRTVKERFGGRIRFFVSGGAPLPEETARFFHALGLLVLEGYGLTESGAASCVNRPDDFVFGTVGPPLPGCEVAVADDGEILLRSRGIMSGYHGLPQETAEVLGSDGWLRTGDLGQLLPTGHLRITGRRKEIVVTSGGKNVAPSNFERRLKARWPYVAYAVLHGDRRPYCVALISLDFDRIGPWARERRIPFARLTDLAHHPQVRALIQEGIDEVNRELPPWEQARRFALLETPLSIEAGLLTPTGKVKRAAVERRFRPVLDALYASEEPEAYRED